MSSGGETAAINNLRHMITSARGPLCDGLVVVVGAVIYASCPGWIGRCQGKSKGDSHGSLIFNQVHGDDG